MSEEFTIRDSGKRIEFEGGMARDTEDNKIDYTNVLHGPMFKRWAAHLTKAKVKYPDPEPGVPNWTLAKGLFEYVRFKSSALRHFLQWFWGELDEDHAAATIFNINGAEFVKEKMNAESISRQSFNNGGKDFRLDPYIYRNDGAAFNITLTEKQVEAPRTDAGAAGGCPVCAAAGAGKRA